MIYLCCTMRDAQNMRLQQWIRNVFHFFGNCITVKEGEFVSILLQTSVLLFFRQHTSAVFSSYCNLLCAIQENAFPCSIYLYNKYFLWLI